MGDSLLPPDESLKALAAVGDSTAKVLKEVPAYKDGIQPIAKELGTQSARIVKTTGDAIHAALTPVRMAIWGFDKIENWVKSTTEKKLAGIPPEEIKEPAVNVLGPAIEGLKFTAQNSELREMFGNLIAATLHPKSHGSAHPSFVEAIKQLSRVEALFIREFVEHKIAGVPLIDVRCYSKDGSFTVPMLNFGEINLRSDDQDYELSNVELDNLIRLRIIEIVELPMAKPTSYDNLISHSKVQQKMKDIQAQDCRWSIERKTLQLSNYGSVFATICVAGKLE